jgi:hypothetical protein
MTTTAHGGPAPIPRRDELGRLTVP